MKNQKVIAIVITYANIKLVNYSLYTYFIFFTLFYRVKNLYMIFKYNKRTLFYLQFKDKKYYKLIYSIKLN